VTPLLRVILVGPSVIASLAGCTCGVDPFEEQDPVICEPGTIGCRDGGATQCNEEGTAWVTTERCEDRSLVCVSDLGCVTCEPFARRCQGDAVLLCTSGGERWELFERCEGEAFCFEGSCDADCARAGALRSYVGCEYVAVTLMNRELSPDFLPALVIGNGNDLQASVTIERGRSFSERVIVPAGSTLSFELPWVSDLKDGTSMGLSANTIDAAYRVESTLPVTIYQFNPLQYALQRDCRGLDTNPGDGVCFSYSNDASLLLPVPALTEHYFVMSRPAFGMRSEIVEAELESFHFSPSLLAVVNPQETEVTVEVRPTAPVSSGLGVSALEAGELGSFTLEPGGVLQLATELPIRCDPDVIEPELTPCSGGFHCELGYCDLGSLDLTGTEITASAPVAVFGGHDCAFVPFDRWACDHLEEQLFPYETWGRHYVIEGAHRENEEPDVIRVLSGVDGNRVRFLPEGIHREVQLDRGEHFELEAFESLEIVADEPILVGQFLVGQNYNFVPAEQDLPPGDPAFALAVPVEQWRFTYHFLAPDTFDRSFVSIVTSRDNLEAITLDGASLTEEDWRLVGTSSYVGLSLEITPGAHVLRSTSEERFGILVYGFGQYTSYMVPGGLNLEPIAVW
jgi:hypothetical protein